MTTTTTASTTSTRRRKNTTSPAQRAEWAATRDARLAELHEQVATGVAHLVQGDAWQNMLNAARRFHRYSLGNQLLIVAQRPEATQVAGFTTWKSLGRQVRKGERGIGILAPCPIRPTDDTPAAAPAAAGAAGQAPAPRMRWRAATVFDIAQTEGDPVVTTADLVTVVDGEAPAGLWDGLAAQVAAHGYTVERGDCGTADGWTNPATQVVRIGGDTRDAAAVSVLAHELAHIVCAHVQDVATYATCRGRCEIEAESVAYIVTGARGLDTSGGSFGYVAGWAQGHPDQVRSTADTVLRAARTILDQLDTTAEGTTAEDTDSEEAGQ
jgi:antirestriction protein ArdC